MENKWTITEKEKDNFIDNLTNELAVLRAKAGIPQEELSKLIGISRQTYGAIERKQRRMSWSTYLALILFFDYTKVTHDMLRKLPAFPEDLINRFNEYSKDNNLDIEKTIGMKQFNLEEKLDDRALHAIKTVIMLEYARCNEVPNSRVVKSIENMNLLKEIFKINDIYFDN